MNSTLLCPLCGNGIIKGIYWNADGRVNEIVECRAKCHYRIQFEFRNVWSYKYHKRLGQEPFQIIEKMGFAP